MEIANLRRDKMLGRRLHTLEYHCWDLRSDRNSLYYRWGGWELGAGSWVVVEKSR